MAATTNRATWAAILSHVAASGHAPAGAVLGEPRSAIQSGLVALIPLDGQVDESTLGHPREVHRVLLRLYREWLAQPEAETELALDAFRADIEQDVMGDFDLGGTIAYALPSEFSWEYDEVAVGGAGGGGAGGTPRVYRVISVMIGYRVDDRAAFG